MSDTPTPIGHVSMTMKEAEEHKRVAKVIALNMEAEGVDRVTGLMALAFILNAAISDIDNEEHKKMVFSAVIAAMTGQIIIEEDNNEQQD